MLRMLATLVLFCACGAPSAFPAHPAESVRRFLESVRAGADPLLAGQRLDNARLLTTLYERREYEPIWTADGPLRQQLPDLLASIEASVAHGLNPADYHLSALQAASGDVPASPLTVELLASDAFLQQVRHRSSGAVSPRELDPGWHLIPPEVDPVASLVRAIGAEGSVTDTLEGLWPRSREYRRLVDRRAEIMAGGELEARPLPSGPALAPGQSGERVLALKDRLLGPDQEHSVLFDDTLEAAVVALQRAAGLEPDGIVGPATLEILNATRFSWIDRIDANLERWRWLPRQRPDTYVRVNIAAYRLQVVRAGEAVLGMDVIVGKPYRRTPVFTESIKYLVVNPFWNVPYRLAVHDKLPDLQRDAEAVAALGFEARPDGEQDFRPVTDVDWSKVTSSEFRFTLRQRPGPQNALGRVKLMLPNPYAVYLHDTPTRELFSMQERSFSSGCVRLSRALDLAQWVLENDGQTDPAQRLDELAESGETRTFHLETPLPTFIVYFTAFTNDMGEVNFRRDIYRRDQAVIAALRSSTHG